METKLLYYHNWVGKPDIMFHVENKVTYLSHLRTKSMSNFSILSKTDIKVQKTQI